MKFLPTLSSLWPDMLSRRLKSPRRAKTTKSRLKRVFVHFPERAARNLPRMFAVLSLSLSSLAMAEDQQPEPSILAAAKPSALRTVEHYSVERSAAELYSVQLYSVQDYSRIFGRDFIAQSAARLASSSSQGLTTKLLPSPLGLLELTYPPEYSGKISELNTSLPQLMERAFQDAYVLLEKQGILSSISVADYAWRIAVKEKLEFGPNQLGSSHCHTAVMAPPADIYINANRLRTSCEGNAQTLNGLLESLVHEVSHAVEYRLMGLGFSRRQRFHSEGFAMWLQSQYNFQHKRSSEKLERQRVQAVLDARWLPYTFSGSEQDYLLSYALIQTIVGVFGADTLYEIYSEMSSKGYSFIEANEKVTGLNVTAWLSLMRLYYAPDSARSAFVAVGAFTENSSSSSSFILTATLKAFPSLAAFASERREQSTALGLS